MTRHHAAQPGSPEIRSARFDELDARTLYRLLKLRVEVFVVEQKCPYPELDGRDLEPATVHLWAERDGEPIGYLRILTEADGSARIGRVATAGPARGRGVASRLVERALAMIGDRPTVLDAQSHLTNWYARFGFVRTGPEFVEDGIPHVPMGRR
ncbi:GCN5 family acetyltransferase [Carbonactinospora thermoautotrophica]|uniref:GCN5 family acetyltransferase n=1 Tax=Carbonactinospora thermoautotrophica TaxID=1469144 RepID=A0A132MRA5_9ACTN|nr:GNAT family N-acetyltransferase [Carbonactinospora thermoautotrophica]KWX00397.1 GCN5 family acetyltransferase [Carbonactinospora thermoautotrophica]KWX09866.1 GCN5 family acetyltransferase [Carbonactinospora thermoautotrophica]